MLYCKIEGKAQLQLTSKKLCKIHIIWILDSNAMSPSNCWSKYLAAHLLIFVIQPSSSVKFLGFKLRLCKKIQISGVPGSPPFPCLPEIELLDQVFLDFGGSRGGRWPSSYQTIICECHSHPHKTALWCQIFSQILIVGSKRRLLKKARSKTKCGSPT